MLKVIQSPSKYIQGANALQSIGQYAKMLANNYFVIADDFVMKLAGDTVGTSLKQHDVECQPSPLPMRQPVPFPSSIVKKASLKSI